MVFGFERKCAMASLPLRSSPFMLCLFVATCLILLRNTSIITSTTKQLSTAVKDRDDHLRQQQHSSPSPSSYSPCGDDDVLPGLPDVNLFMIIGCAKCGTTSLQQILNVTTLSSSHSNKKVEVKIGTDPCTGNCESHYFDFLCKFQLKELPVTKRAIEDVCGSMGSSDSKSNYSSNMVTTITDEEACLIRNHYFQTGLGSFSKPQKLPRQHSNSSMWVLDKTPSYMRVSGVARVVKHIVGGGLELSLNSGGDGSNSNTIKAIGGRHYHKDRLKLAVILRDPVSRLYSAYKYFLNGIRKNPNLPQTFDALMNYYTEAVITTYELTNFPTLNEFLEIRTFQNRTTKELDEQFSFKINKGALLSLNHEDLVKRAKFHERNQVYNSMYAVQLIEWLQHFELGRNFLVIQYEKFKKNKVDVVKNVLKFLNNDYSFDKVKSDQSLSAFRDDYKITIPNQKLTLERRYTKHLNPGAAKMSNLTREYFQKFYSPFNEMLADLLGEEWRNVWGY